MAENNAGLIAIKVLATCARDCGWDEINPRRKPRKCPRCKGRVRVTKLGK